MKLPIYWKKEGELVPEVFRSPGKLGCTLYIKNAETERFSDSGLQFPAR